MAQHLSDAIDPGLILWYLGAVRLVFFKTRTLAHKPRRPSWANLNHPQLPERDLEFISIFGLEMKRY